MQVTFADVFHILVKWRKVILLNFLMFVVVAGVIAFLLPVKFTSTGTVLPQSEEGGLEAGFLSMITDLPVSLPSLPGFSRPGDTYLGILRSRNVREAVIRELDLQSYFETPLMTDALERLSARTFFDLTEEGIVVIQATALSPELARNIAQSFIAQLDRVNGELRRTSAHHSREFLQKRLNDVEMDLRTAAENMKEFQQQNNVIALEEQTRTAIEMSAKLRGEMALKEIELNLAEKSLDSSHPTITGLRAQLEEFRKQIGKIESGANLDSGAFIIPFSQVPDLGLQFAFLAKDLEVQKAIFTLLTQQFEQAKIQEQRDTPTLKILDYPNLPDKKSLPQRRVIVITAGLLSVFVSMLLIFMVEYINRIKAIDAARYDMVIQSWRALLSDIGIKRKQK